LYGNTDETEKTDFPESLNYRLRELEKGMIIEALVRAGGVQTRAAKLLGIKERSLWHRVKKLNIDAVSLKGNVT
jgi:transcriptional regulator with PAS, ATPase and Fis domain